MNKALVCAHCGFHKSHFVLTLDDVMCASCANSYCFHGEGYIVYALKLEELSVCGMCGSAYIKHEDQDHDLCNIICVQTMQDGS